MSFQPTAPTITDQMTMLAIYPPKEVMDHALLYAQEDVVENGLHMTLVNLGRTNEDTAFQLDLICRRVCRTLDPIRLSVEGSGFFVAPDMFIHWLLINGAGLDLWRATLLNVLNRMNLLADQRYGYTPHMTLGYYSRESGFPEGWEESGAPDIGSWVCDRVYLVRGDEKQEISIGEPFPL